MGHRNKILRNVKDVKRKEIEDSIPDEFLCPITRELMSDPVIAAGTILLFHFFTSRFVITYSLRMIFPVSNRKHHRCLLVTTLLKYVNRKYYK